MQSQHIWKPLKLESLQTTNSIDSSFCNDSLPFEHRTFCCIVGRSSGCLPRVFQESQKPSALLPVNIIHWSLQHNLFQYCRVLPHCCGWSLSQTVVCQERRLGKPLHEHFHIHTGGNTGRYGGGVRGRSRN